MSTDLAPFKRGTTFTRTAKLSIGSNGDTFTGGVKFTLRTEIPASTVPDDTDVIGPGVLNGVVAQATDEDGITFAGTGEDLENQCIVTITFPESETRLWPVRLLVWDLVGRITGVGEDPDVVRELSSGTIQILGNVTRS